jgi:hypothetical protein
MIGLAIAILTTTGLYVTHALPAVSGDDPAVHAWLLRLILTYTRTMVAGTQWYIRTYTRLRTHTLTHTYMHTYSADHKRTYLQTHAQSHTHTHTHTHTRMYTHTHTHTHTHIHTHRCVFVLVPVWPLAVDTHTHTHTHAHTHTRTLRCGVERWGHTGSTHTSR